MNFNKFEVYGNPTLRSGGWTRTGEGDAYIRYTNPGEINHYYRICTLDYIPQHHPTQITITGIASKELETSVLVLRSDNYVIASLGWQHNGYTFNLGSTYDKLGVMFRFKNGDVISPNQVSFDIVGDWNNIPHYIMKTSTDTITTLPAVIYANDTTATVGLKGNMEQNGTPTPQNPIQPSECGEMTGNLFDGQLQQGYYTYHNGLYVLADAYVCTHLIPCTENTTYTFRCINTGGGSKNYGYVFFDSSQNRIGDDYINRYTEEDVVTHTATTPQNTAFLAINIAYGRRQDGVVRPSDITDFMLNSGSTALPYEPWGIKIPISSASTTTPVYLGEVETTRRIEKLVLTGEEDWRIWSSGQPDTERYYYNWRKSTPSDYGLICTHFPFNSSDGNYEHIRLGGSNRENFIIFISRTIAPTLADFTAWLAAQYAAGTPVCVWYVLASETTGIVNEMLMKIGDYADTVSGITIPTITGKDTFDVDTTLKPSEVSISYTGWHDATVEEWDGSQWNE